MAQTAEPSVQVTFDLSDDKFVHAWFFNRFRVDKLGESRLVTLALVAESGTALAVNAFVVSTTDVQHNRKRSDEYLKALAEIKSGDMDAYSLNFSLPPERVYPINHMNLSRMEGVAEIGLLRWTPKIGHSGSLTQSQKNDPNVQETTSAQSRPESQSWP